MRQGGRALRIGHVKKGPGDRITQLRLRLMEDGRPQYVIAADLEVSPGRLSEYALGTRPIPEHRIYNFCRVLRCNPDDLLGYADVPIT